MKESAAGETPDPEVAVHTYHCLCSTLILTSLHRLESFPVRASPALDGAYIIPLRNLQSNQTEAESVSFESSIISNTITDQRPIIIRREDGFEKRALLRCTRCELVVGYMLDQAQFEGQQSLAEDVLYVLPGGLVTTEDMKAGKGAAVPVWATEKM